MYLLLKIVIFHCYVSFRVVRIGHGRPHNSMQGIGLNFILKFPDCLNIQGSTRADTPKGRANQCDVLVKFLEHWAGLRFLKGVRGVSQEYHKLLEFSLTFSDELHETLWSSTKINVPPVNSFVAQHHLSEFTASLHSTRPVWRPNTRPRT